MTTTDAPPIACTLAPAVYKDRIAAIGALTRDALRSHERRDLVLELRYAPEARDRVREFVRNEQVCCAFLCFELREVADEVRLTITAPEAAREAAGALFGQFVAGVASSSGQTGSKAAGLTAVTLAAGAVGCGAACVLPFALPAAALASAGGTLAWFASMHGWITALAVLAVVAAWAWIGWQTRRTRCRPAASTLTITAAATALMGLAVLWPLVEEQLAALLRT